MACEKLARYFIRSFKDTQIGAKSTGSIKTTLGADLQSLTEEQAFRFPSTFTFIFRSITSIDGIGKTLDEAFDLGQLSQPFVQALLDRDQAERTGLANVIGADAAKSVGVFQKATGLNAADVNTALQSPRKIQYLEDTVRAMEQGSLKIRVRSLENEQALERLAISQGASTSLLLGSVALNCGLALSGPLVSGVAYAAACAFGAQALGGFAKVKAFDKKAAKYVTKTFES